ncbi:MAG TPA: ATP-grasp domain-containing protein [Acidimicrobiales bacterium]|nr:ATP-grasp domain-containing protein [Acidimicrobiales bacterium]
MERMTSDGGRVGGPLPRVIVVYGASSFNPMVLAEAAAQAPCRLVWVVDGGDPFMAPLVRLLRRMGDVVDSSGLHADAIADELIPTSPAGITTFSDEYMPLTAALARRLSLAYHSEETAVSLADKKEQRRALRSAGVPSPAVWEVPADLSDLPSFVESLGYPVVVKPRQGTGSFATALANDEGELSDHLARLADVEAEFLVEEYLPDRDPRSPFADDLAVEIMVQGGRVFRLATTGKFRHAPPFRGRGCFLPSSVDAATETEMFDAAEAAAVALGITDGFLNVDVKLTPVGTRIVEVNGRLGGNVDMLMELAGGPPVLPLVFRLALGRDMTADPALPSLLSGNWSRVGYFAWVQAPMAASRLSGVAGIDEVAALPHVSTVIRNRNQGDSLDWALGGRSNVCAVFGAVENLEDLVAARRQIDDLIEVDFDEASDQA